MGHENEKDKIHTSNYEIDPGGWIWANSSMLG